MQITQTTTDNLFKVLALIEKRVDRKEAMNFSAMCREHHIGDSVRNKLKYALLEHVYDYKDRALGPSKKMYISRDKKTWKFKFRHPYGVAQWHLTDDLGDILAAMQMCPKEIANPFYYKDQPIKEVVVEAPAVPEQPVAINYAGRPVQPEQLTDEELELGIKEYNLSLQLLQQEKEKRDAIKAKKAELLKVFSEMAKDEGFSLEDIVGIV
jgi:hypothetical protein